MSFLLWFDRRADVPSQQQPERLRKVWFMKDVSEFWNQTRALTALELAWKESFVMNILKEKSVAACSCGPMSLSMLWVADSCKGDALPEVLNFSQNKLKTFITVQNEHFKNRYICEDYQWSCFLRWVYVPGNMRTSFKIFVWIRMFVVGQKQIFWNKTFNTLNCD